MNEEASTEKLLRWFMAHSETAAPPLPRMAPLLAELRPWWEIWPEQFRNFRDQLFTIQSALGHAKSEPNAPRGGFLVPLLAMLRDGKERESCARVLYLSVRDQRLTLRLQLDDKAGVTANALEVTFVSEATTQPLFIAEAVYSVGSEYRLDVEITEELARDWGQLRVADRMPFRLILRPSTQLQDESATQ